jgi:glycosyltransferase involved in cell wall biosynthesis
MVTVLHDGSCNDYFSFKLALTERILTNRLAGLIAVNPDALDSYRNTIRDASDIAHVITNGISLERFEPVPDRRSELRENLGIDLSRKLILQVGRINRVKRQHLTIDAIRAMVDQGWNPKVLFAGIIEERDYFEDCIKSATGLDVEFLGARSDIPDLMDAADLLLMPSTQEAHSVAFLEALASRKPIVASRIPSFLPYERMEGVSLADPELPVYTREIVSALQHSHIVHQRDLSGYTIERTCDEYDTVALEVTNSSRRPAKNSQ